MVKNSAVSIGGCHVVPLSNERASATEFPKPKNVPGNGKRRHATYARLLRAAKRGIDACPSDSVDATTTLCDQVGVAAFFRLSEYVVRISTPKAVGAGVKLDQLIMTRPVSGSTSMNSLSAASCGTPPTTMPLGFVTDVTSNGPSQVLPQSRERCTPMVCTSAELLTFSTRIDE